jgi:hypothetical protein
MQDLAGFQSFYTAWRTMAGFEAMLEQRKGFAFPATGLSPTGAM